VNAQNASQLFLFVILPYLALTVFVVGHIWRYKFDRFGWTSQSSQLYERPMLLLGSPLFHYGTLLAIAGHALGLLVPESWTKAIGISESAYATLSKIAGSTAAILVIIGLAVLTYRRLVVDRVRGVTGIMDYVAFGLMWFVIALGFTVTVLHNTLGPSYYNYRSTVSVWIRGILTFHPDAAVMTNVPAIFQIHFTAAWLFLAVFPFTRLVHFWSAPVSYLTRPFVVYRRRRGQTAFSPGESRSWQTFGRSGGGPDVGT
jgi:nitrate reductase gamma subunit